MVETKPIKIFQSNKSNLPVINQQIDERHRESDDVQNQFELFVVVLVPDFVVTVEYRYINIAKDNLQLTQNCRRLKMHLEFNMRARGLPSNTSCSFAANFAQFRQFAPCASRFSAQFERRPSVLAVITSVVDICGKHNSLRSLIILRGR